MYEYEGLATVRIIVEAESQDDAHDKMTRILRDTVYDIDSLEVL